MMNNYDVISLSRVCKKYGENARETLTLNDVSVDFKCGEFTAVVGKSGSGKSTLLNMVSGIDRPTSGEIRHGTNMLHDMSEKDLTEWRGKYIGIVFQFFQLIPTLTVLENLMLPMDFCGIVPQKQRKEKARELLDRMMVEQYANSLPVLLSGGEQQRVAIARALVNNPIFIIADEPTGNLDSQNTTSIIKLFRDMTAEGKAIIMVTHNNEISVYADRIVSINDGVIENDARTVK